jgi:hypothetical protein
LSKYNISKVFFKSFQNIIFTRCGSFPLPSFIYPSIYSYYFCISFVYLFISNFILYLLFMSVTTFLDVHLNSLNALVNSSSPLNQHQIAALASSTLDDALSLINRYASQRALDSIALSYLLAWCEQFLPKNDAKSRVEGFLETEGQNRYDMILIKLLWKCPYLHNMIIVFLCRQRNIYWFASNVFNHWNTRLSRYYECINLPHSSFRIFHVFMRDYQREWSTDGITITSTKYLSLAQSDKFDANFEVFITFIITLIDHYHSFVFYQ